MPLNRIFILQGTELDIGAIGEHGDRNIRQGVERFNFQRTISKSGTDTVCKL